MKSSEALEHTIKLINGIICDPVVLNDGKPKGYLKIETIKEPGNVKISIFYVDNIIAPITLGHMELYFSSESTAEQQYEFLCERIHLSFLRYLIFPDDTVFNLAIPLSRLLNIQR